MVTFTSLSCVVLWFITPCPMSLLSVVPQSVSINTPGKASAQLSLLPPNCPGLIPNISL